MFLEKVELDPSQHYNVTSIAHEYVLHITGIQNSEYNYCAKYLLAKTTVILFMATVALAIIY